ncbi:hypothetical protein D3C78_1342960 [compost metagenome]
MAFIRVYSTNWFNCHTLHSHFNLNRIFYGLSVFQINKEYFLSFFNYSSICFSSGIIMHMIMCRGISTFRLLWLITATA